MLQIERDGHILQSLGATAFSEDGVRLCPLILLRVFLNSRGECPKYVMSRSCRGSASYHGAYSWFPCSVLRKHSNMER